MSKQKTALNITGIVAAKIFVGRVAAKRTLESRIIAIYKEHEPSKATIEQARKLTAKYTPEQIATALENKYGAKLEVGKSGGKASPSAAETEAATSSAQPKAEGGKSSSAIGVGTRVEVYWDVEQKWFAGSVTKVNANGSCDIHYDDGDEESAVPAELVRIQQQAEGQKEPSLMDAPSAQPQRHGLTPAHRATMYGGLFATARRERKAHKEAERLAKQSGGR